MRKLVLLLGLVLAGCASTVPSNDPFGLNGAAERAHNTIPLPFSLLIPEGIRLGYDMRAYIASPEFGSFDSSIPAEAAFNEIYYQALEYSHDDLPVAFLAASFGSFEHENIPLALFHIKIPLTSEQHARFLLRWSHIPAHLYHIEELDRDKPQHFFASAWLKSAFGMNWLAELGGIAVEVGESLFVEGGSIDPRDLHANRDGIHFAKKAEGDPLEPPSRSLTKNP